MEKIIRTPTPCIPLHFAGRATGRCVGCSCAAAEAQRCSWQGATAGSGPATGEVWTMHLPCDPHAFALCSSSVPHSVGLWQSSKCKAILAGMQLCDCPPPLTLHCCVFVDFSTRTAAPLHFHCLCPESCAFTSAAPCRDHSLCIVPHRIPLLPSPGPSPKMQTWVMIGRSRMWPQMRPSSSHRAGESCVRLP